MTDECISVSQAAAIMKVHRSRVYALIEQDRLPVETVKCRYWLKRADVEAFKPNPTGIQLPRAVAG